MKREYSEREVAELQRSAFWRGASWLYSQEEIPGGPVTAAASSRASAAAAREYPLPKVTRPRVISDPYSKQYDWRNAKDHYGEYRMEARDRESGVWLPWCDFHSNYRICAPLPDRVRLWADLLANPTEEVEDDA